MIDSVPGTLTKCGSVGTAISWIEHESSLEPIPALSVQPQGAPLTVRNIRIQPHQQQVSPMARKPAPQRIGSAPFIQRDWLTVGKVGLKDLARLLRHVRAVEADHQLVIDIKAARVKVGGSDVNQVVNDEELRVQNLRL